MFKEKSVPVLMDLVGYRLRSSWFRIAEYITRKPPSTRLHNEEDENTEYNQVSSNHSPNQTLKIILRDA